MTVTAIPPCPAWRLASAPEVVVARINLGLTVYLDEPRLWASGGAADLLEQWLAVLPGGTKPILSSSAASGSLPLAPTDVQRLLHDLRPPNPVAPRHMLKLALGDSAVLPRWGFVYREARPSSGRDGYLQILLPEDAAPETLLSFVTAVGQRLPFRCALAGPVATWNPAHQATAFWAIYGWCKRYLALDVQVPEEMSWHVRAGLPGCAWITMLGRSFLRALAVDEDAVAREAKKAKLRWADFAEGVALAVDEPPSLGDLNLLAYPHGHAAMARILAPYLLPEIPPFWGRFWKEKDTQGWFRRFLDPVGWT